MREFLRSKIHKAIVTKTDLSYEGSIGIDGALAEMAGFKDGEKVLIVDNTNGARIETYVIFEEKNSAEVIMYGASAHLIKKGDEIIIMGFEIAEEPPKQIKVLLDKNNKFVKYL
jgi:aspartate 1-decarboxylase